MNLAIRSILAGAGLAALACQTTAQEGTPTMETKNVVNQSVSLSVFHTGPASGTNVIFLHSDSGAAAQWFRVMDDLADEHPVAAFDQRGHGSSSPAANGDYIYEIRAADLQAVVASFGSRQTILVAHSGSAGVALEYARTHAGSLRGIYFLDPASDPRSIPEDMRQGFLGAIESESGLEAVQGYLASIAGQNPMTIETVTGDAAMVAPDARFEFAQALMNWNAEAAMSHWTGPAFMAITPANDTPASIRHFGETVEYSILPAEGHWAQLDTPESVAQSIRTFINGLP